MSAETVTAVFGKKVIAGVTPALFLQNPKYARNVGAAVRAASCFGVTQVWYSGDRVPMTLADRKPGEKKRRLPREERMKGYKNVELRQHDYVFDCFERGKVTPVAVELSQGAELLPTFEHPEDALYVFGPEDGSLNHVAHSMCHRRVVIPTRHCLNLATAIVAILYDRALKAWQSGAETLPTMAELLAEPRGFIDTDAVFDGELG